MNNISKMLISLCTVAALAGCVSTGSSGSSKSNGTSADIPNQTDNSSDANTPNNSSNADNTDKPSIPDEQPSTPDYINGGEGSGFHTVQPNMPDHVNGSSSGFTETQPSPTPPPPPSTLLYNENTPLPQEIKNKYRKATKIEDSNGNIVPAEQIKNIMDLDGKTFTEAGKGSGGNEYKYTVTINKDSGLITEKDTRGKILKMTYLQDFSEYSATLKNGGDVYLIGYSDTFDKNQHDDYTRYNALPTGKAAYTGYAVGSNSEQQGKTKQPMHGTTYLNVDFHGKTVEGVIIIPKQTIITLEKTKIAGGTFNANYCRKSDCQIAKYEGKVRESGQETGGYKGYFYGDNATETAGNVWYNSNIHGFAFGGKKTEQNK